MHTVQRMGWTGCAVFPFFVFMYIQHNDRDPFRVVIGLINDSDLLLRVAFAAGLQFEGILSEVEAYSHKTRFRVLAPRILAAYDSLDGGNQLKAALAAVEALRCSGFDMDAVGDGLNKAGWELRDAGFVVRSPVTREIFFPRGSPWDAFVVLRDLFAEAQDSIVIVDPYCDTSVFHMLEKCPRGTLDIRILCSRHADTVATGARAFMGQHKSISVQVRTTRDFHDRFIVLDGTVCVHVGASIKDAGNKACMVSRIEDSGNRDAMLRQLCKSWEAGRPVQGGSM